MRLADEYSREFKDAGGWLGVEMVGEDAVKGVSSAFSFDRFFASLPRRTRSSVRGPIGAGQGGGELGGRRRQRQLPLTQRLQPGILSPSITVSGLTEEQQGQLWRYLREALQGDKGPMLPRVLAALQREGNGRFLRVKVSRGGGGSC